MATHALRLTPKQVAAAAASKVLTLTAHVGEAVWHEVVKAAILSFVAAGTMIAGSLVFSDAAATVLGRVMANVYLRVGGEFWMIQTALAVSVFMVLAVVVFLCEPFFRIPVLPPDPDPVNRIAAALLVSHVMLLDDDLRPALLNVVERAPDDVDLDELVDQLREPDYSRPIWAMDWPTRA